VRNREHSLYITWKNLRQRCNNRKHPKYKNYGGRGITVAAAWDDFWSFVADVGVRPEGTTLDREDNDGPYCKDNCRWITAAAQAANKTTNRKYELRGEVLTRAELGRRFGIPDTTLRFRLNNGWTTEEAVTHGL
jgi:hypothetical protein